MGRHTRRALLAGAALLTAAAVAGGGAASADRPAPLVIDYDSFSDGDGYTLADYEARWSNGYGLGELADVDTRTFDNDTFRVAATPFETTFDYSVFDHIKYLATSDRSFAVPERGSITFAVTIDAETPGTQPGRVIRGVYGPPGCADDPACASVAAPYEATLLEGQQAGATLHMIDFRTGQLFDWFVSGSTAFALIERLPDNVIGSGSGGTRSTMYTQIVKEVAIAPGPHRVEIRLWRDGSAKSAVEYFLDGRRVARVKRIGVPLDVQKKPYTGIYPSMGPGEDLTAEVDSVTIGHGLFSLLDAFPFQHPDAPELSVSISPSQRLFGQGARATFDDFVVTIDPRD